MYFTLFFTTTMSPVQNSLCCFPLSSIPLRDQNIEDISLSEQNQGWCLKVVHVIFLRITILGVRPHSWYTSLAFLPLKCLLCENISILFSVVSQFPMSDTNTRDQYIEDLTLYEQKRVFCLKAIHEMISFLNEWSCKSLRQANLKWELSTDSHHWLGNFCPIYNA